jgi:hypothetical protein
MLSLEQLASFRRDGYLLVPGLVPHDVRLDALVAIDQLICAKWPAFRRSTRGAVAEDVQSKIFELGQADRRVLARVYDAIRKIAPFWSMAGGEALTQTSRELLASETVGVAFRGCGIRLDLPDEDRWRSAWHQEYHSQMSSLRAVTAWFGLVPVTSRMGPVEILTGSQAEGLLPVRCLDPMNTKKNYTETFVMPGLEDLLRRYPRASFETEPGDVLFLDFFTLHQSGYNRDSFRSRITCQVRYFDMLDESAIAHDWVGGWQEGGDFRALHPDKVIA